MNITSVIINQINIELLLCPVISVYTGTPVVTLTYCPRVGLRGNLQEDAIFGGKNEGCL